MAPRAREVQVRSGTEADIGPLTDIYNHYVRETAVTFDTVPFTPQERLPWLRSHPEDGPHRLLVAQDVPYARILGYVTSSPFRAKPAYSTSVEVSVYCAPDAAGAASARCCTRRSSRRWSPRTSTAPTRASRSPTRPPGGCTRASASGTWGRTRRSAGSSAATGTWPGTRSRSAERPGHGGSARPSVAQPNWSDLFARPIQKPSMMLRPSPSSPSAAPSVTNSGAKCSVRGWASRPAGALCSKSSSASTSCASSARCPQSSNSADQPGTPDRCAAARRGCG